MKTGFNEVKYLAAYHAWATGARDYPDVGAPEFWRRRSVDELVAAGVLDDRDRPDRRASAPDDDEEEGASWRS